MGIKSTELEGGYLVLTLKSVENAINKDIGSKPDFIIVCILHLTNCLLQKIKARINLKIKEIYPAPYLFVGDNETDYWAAKKANIDFCFVKTGYGERHSPQFANNCFIFNRLEQVATWLIEGM